MTLAAIVAAWGQDALYAAQREADLADQWEGLDDPDTDRLSQYHRRTSLALLALALSGESTQWT